MRGGLPRNQHPNTEEKCMKQAVEMDEGQSFKWQNDVYVVVRHEKDNVVVCRVASLCQTGLHPVPKTPS